MDLDKLLQNSIHRKIITFFHENPASIDTPRGIAAWVGEERQKVKRALDELVQMGLLLSHKASSTTGYSYTQDNKLIKKIGELLKHVD